MASKASRKTVQINMANKRVRGTIFRNVCMSKRENCCWHN